MVSFRSTGLLFLELLAPCQPGAIPLYPFTFPPFTLFFSIFYFCISLYYSLHLFSCFSIPSNSNKIVPLRFRVGCLRRRLNLALVFCVC